MAFSRRFPAILLASAISAFPATAQDGGEPAPTAQADASDTDREIFRPVFFERFAPQTALEMVERVPGFQIDGQSSARGLGQGGANVLLNGTRFAAKSVGIEDALQRIPASDVIRIELVDGATLDIPGLSGQVVNVVYSASAGSGQFRWSPVFRTRGADPVLLDGEISWAGQVGRVDYTLSLSNRSARRGNDGPERLLDAAGNLVELRQEESRYESERPRLSGTIARQFDAGQTLNLNGAVELYLFEATEERIGTLASRDFVEREDEINYELGGDYAFDVVGGRLKLIGLHRFEASDFLTDVATAFVAPRPREAFRQDLFIDETETIARGEFAWNAGESDWQVSLEGALNSLETGNVVEVLAPTGIFVPLPSAPDTTVEEQRAEAALTWGRRLAGDVSVQATLASEYSRLSQSGANCLTRSFLRPKGEISAAWRASDTLDVRARIAREVGQLDFFDFVASTDLGSGNQQAGNPNLVPQQSWEFDLSATKGLGPWGSLTLRSVYVTREGRVTQVPIGATGEAPGNVDGANSFFVKATGTILFAPLGWEGAQLEIDTYYRTTSIPDPLTGLRRPFSNDVPWQIDADLRHDVPGTDWAWGGGLFANQRLYGVRLNQISLDENAGVNASLFVENKDVAGLRIRASVSNLLDLNENYRRTVYVNRRDGPVAFTEERFRTYGTIFTLDISGTFG